MKATTRRRQDSSSGYQCGDESSARLLAVALERFGEQGFEGASTRDIAERAGLNAPALNYYFRNKHGLYLACVEYMTQRVSEALSPAIEQAEATVAGGADRETLIEAFCALHRSIAQLMLRSPETAGWRKFYAREQAGLGPGDGEQQMHAVVGQRLLAVTCTLVARLRGQTEVDQASTLRAITLHGQLLPFHLTPGVTLAALGWQDFAGERFEQVIEMVCEQTRTLLLGIAPLSIN
ncbi:CerR family C-terminal domain-containing protein [Pseudomonas sp. 148P]|uniref:CerR family C-terminal domain-containing protein n=1 Tax=Pseudomonas ulcerans TaxID=3115852 RepID=A0ABU7HKQ7_9PSED|nr:MULTISPECIES: CerR family C-terminal domain-containing protein [unclassified Pseudomonas]MEE1920972.1 CerR family C-terminal domain-containing protein [Pseudomonas sp. 147P]MEE1932127.1 CerR family C-terminal domain-containing protein [Pseudomonas sp. 148P]